MAYNNGFPMTYPQYYPQYPQQQIPQPQLAGTQMSSPQPAPQNPVSNGIIWVQGEAGAKSYLVAPNNTIQLWDSESQTIYLKSADASGMPSMKILDYTIRDTNPQIAPAIAPVDTANYVTKEELADLEERIRRKLEKMTPKKEVKKDE